MPSDQNRIIEQAKFTYSPLEKAFEKQIIIEDQGEKQIKAHKKHRKQLVRSDENNELLFSKEKEIFQEMYTKRNERIEELSKKIDYNNLKYYTHKTGREIGFIKLKNPIVFLDGMKANKILMDKHEINKKNLQKNKAK